MLSYEMTPYEYDEYLMHHGVKGMKWGVRRYQNEDGTWKKKGRIGSSERVRQKQAVLRNKINRSDHNFIARNTINDYRRGRVAALEAKAQHREAREKGQRTFNKAGRRFIPNIGLARDNMFRGSYNRAREKGHGFFRSVASATGHKLARQAAGAAVATAGALAARAVLSRLGRQKPYGYLPTNALATVPRQGLARRAVSMIRR